MLKNWCFWTVVLEETLESLLDCKEIQPVHPKGYWSWIFIGRTDAEAETPVLWPPGVKNWLIGKDPYARKDWRQEEKGMTEDEMVGWHHRLNGHGFGWTPGAGDGQGGLACCSPRGHKESDTTEWLNWTSLTKPSVTLSQDFASSIQPQGTILAAGLGRQDSFVPGSSQLQRQGPHTQKKIRRYSFLINARATPGARD